MCRQIMAFPLCMHSGFPMENVEWTIVMLFYDVTMIPHAIEGGKYIKRQAQALGLSFGFLELNSWVNY